MSSNITVSIDRLILDSLPTEGMSSEALSAEVRRELASLLAERGMHKGIAAGGAWGSIRGGEITGIEADPGQLGTQIAQAIHAGLGGQRGEAP
jgi:hypothetical protein